MGIEQFVLEKGKFICYNSSGMIDNRLSEVNTFIITKLSNLLRFIFYYVCIVIIVGTVFSYARELVHYVRFDLDKKNIIFLSKLI